MNLLWVDLEVQQLAGFDIDITDDFDDDLMPGFDLFGLFDGLSGDIAIDDGFVA